MRFATKNHGLDSPVVATSLAYIRGTSCSSTRIETSKRPVAMLRQVALRLAPRLAPAVQATGGCSCSAGLHTSTPAGAASRLHQYRSSSSAERHPPHTIAARAWQHTMPCCALGHPQTLTSLVVYGRSATTNEYALRRV